MSQGRRPLIEKLYEAGRAEEDLYFAKRDRELIARLRKVEDEGQRRHIQELAYMRCPDCGARLKRATHYGVTIEECPSGHGMWLTDSELHTVAKRERSSWIGRYFYRPKL
jgi:predicted nucleic acid-binding Zn ribbon protein